MTTQPVLFEIPTSAPPKTVAFDPYWQQMEAEVKNQSIAEVLPAEEAIAPLDAQDIVEEKTEGLEGEIKAIASDNKPPTIIENQVEPITTGKRSTALRRSPRPRLIVTVPPVPNFKPGDRVTFPLFCFGEPRTASGVVVECTTNNPLKGSGDRVPCPIPGTVCIEFEVSLPPLDELASIYHGAYPKNGLYSGAAQMPCDRVSYEPALQLVLGGSELIQLQQQRIALLNLGLAIEGAWIETGKVKGRDFRQAWWRSSRPCFAPKRVNDNPEARVKTSYIGEENSEAHQAARALWQRRKDYERLGKAIAQLEAKL